MKLRRPLVTEIERHGSANDRRIRRVQSVLATCLLTMFLGVAVADAQPATSSAGAAALTAWNEKDPVEAERLSRLALDTNPDDARALLVRALLARSRNRPVEMFRAARAAYRNSDLEALRFDAALLAADALARQERFSRSQLWLRRADQAAPDAERRALAERTYRAVAARNPLKVTLRFGIGPSSNVNNGAETTVIEIGGLPFTLDDSGLQLGGYEAEAGVSLSYRISESAVQATEILGEVFYRNVWLDSDAETTAPDAEGSDFDYGVVVAGVRHRRLIWPGLGPTTFSGVLGQTWYGNRELARWGDAKITQTVRRSDTTALRFGVSLRQEARLDDPVNDSTSLGLSVEHLSVGQNGSRNTVGAFVRDVRSESATVDRLAIGVSAERVFDRMGPVLPRLSLSAETKDYREWVATPGGRRDTSVGVQLDATWADMRYFGFSPQVSFQARRTWSDVDIYDRNEVSIGLNVISRF